MASPGAPASELARHAEDRAAAELTLPAAWENVGVGQGTGQGRAGSDTGPLHKQPDRPQALTPVREGVKEMVCEAGQVRFLAFGGLSQRPRLLGSSGPGELFSDTLLPGTAAAAWAEETCTPSFSCRSTSSLVPAQDRAAEEARGRRKPRR